MLPAADKVRRFRMFFIKQDGNRVQLGIHRGRLRPSSSPTGGEKLITYYIVWLAYNYKVTYLLYNLNATKYILTPYSSVTPYVYNGGGESKAG